MKNGSRFALVLGLLGVLLVALGLYLPTVLAWSLRGGGIVCGVLGAIVLLAALLFWAKSVGVFVVSVVGTVLLGMGVCIAIYLQKIMFGFIVGVIGAVVLLTLIPLVKRRNKIAEKAQGKADVN